MLFYAWNNVQFPFWGMLSTFYDRLTYNDCRNVFQMFLWGISPIRTIEWKWSLSLSIFIWGKHHLRKAQFVQNWYHFISATRKFWDSDLPYGTCCIFLWGVGGSRLVTISVIWPLASTKWFTYAQFRFCGGASNVMYMEGVANYQTNYQGSWNRQGTNCCKKVLVQVQRNMD